MLTWISDQLSSWQTGKSPDKDLREVEVGPKILSEPGVGACLQHWEEAKQSSGLQRAALQPGFLISEPASSPGGQFTKKKWHGALQAPASGLHSNKFINTRGWILSLSLSHNTGPTMTPSHDCSLFHKEESWLILSQQNGWLVRPQMRRSAEMGCLTVSRMRGENVNGNFLSWNYDPHPSQVPSAAARWNSSKSHSQCMVLALPIIAVKRWKGWFLKRKWEC